LIGTDNIENISFSILIRRFISRVEKTLNKKPCYINIEKFITLKENLEYLLKEKDEFSFIYKKRLDDLNLPKCIKKIDELLEEYKVKVPKDKQKELELGGGEEWYRKIS